MHSRAEMSGGAVTQSSGSYGYVDQLSPWLVTGLKAQSDSFANIGERFLPGPTLRNAAGEHRTFDDDPTILAGPQNDWKCVHACRV